jgi:hypothetical protein
VSDQLAAKQAVVDPQKAGQVDVKRVLENVAIGVAVVDKARVGDDHLLVRVVAGQPLAPVVSSEPTARHIEPTSRGRRVYLPLLSL